MMNDKQLNEHLYLFLSTHLKIEVISAGTPTLCGGEYPGNYGVKVRLLLKNPETGFYDEISSDKSALDY